MSYLRELYQETIVDHSKHPRNFAAMPEAQFIKEGFNPLCGDRLTVYLSEADGVINELSFQGCGCAISIASASLMIETVKGKSKQEIEQLFEDFHQLITEGTLPEVALDRLGKLAVLGGVAEYPVRVKCATLAWHTLKAAYNHDATPISTE